MPLDISQLSRYLEGVRKHAAAEQARQEERRLERVKKGEAERIRLLGAKPDYPLLVCQRCGEVVGWLGDPRRVGLFRPDLGVDFEQSVCHDCLWRQAGYRLPEQWLDSQLLEGIIPSRSQAREIGRELARLSDPPLPLWTRLLKPVWPSPYRRRALQNWLRFVDGWGPGGPQEGFALDGFEKSEFAALDGSGRLIRFASGRYVFSRGRWIRLKTQRRSAWGVDVPGVFSARLPIEQLAAAWLEFQRQAMAEEAKEWQESEAQELRRRTQEALDSEQLQLVADRDAAERGTVDLLP